MAAASFSELKRYECESGDLGARREEEEEKRKKGRGVINGGAGT